MSTMVFEYYLRSPEKEQEQIVIQQLRASYEYYNTLIRIEQNRRNQFRAIQSQDPKIAQLELEISSLDTEIDLHLTSIQNTRSTNRKNVLDKKDVDRVKSLKADRKLKRDELKIAKKSFCDNLIFQKACEDINLFAKNESKAARKATPSYWGSYLLIENAIDAAKKSKTDPKRKYWDWTGRLGVQVQGGMSVSELFGNDTRIQIDPVSLDAWYHPIRGKRKYAQRQPKLRFRINSDDKGKPIFVEFPMIMHRPLPQNACIKQANVIVTNRDRKLCYVLQLTVNIPEPVASPCTNGVGIDLGWRLMDSGDIRVAYGYDQKGTKIDLRLPKSITSLFQKAESIRAIRDKEFEDHRKIMIPLIQGVTFPNINTTNIGLSKSFRRFHSLYLGWKANRQDGDQIAFDALETWHRKDRHLEQYEVGCRKRAMNYRREEYRKFAKQMTSTYGYLALENWNISKVALRPEIEDGTREQSEPQHQRVMACVSMLRQILINTAKREGVSIISVPAAYTTLECAACHKINTWDTSKNVCQTCENCDTVWDQDENAARNLLASGTVLKNTAPLPEEANIANTEKKSRWSKRKAEVVIDEKVDRSQIAS